MIRRYRWWLSALTLLFIVGLVAIFALSGPGNETRQERPPGPPGTGPMTIVTLGDSTLSGEGAGNYTPDTDGSQGNWCHRSPNAEVHHTSVPGIEEKINLACSGAPSNQVALGEIKQWTEGSQAQRLKDLTRDHRIATVVVAVGANDDPHFSALVNSCIAAWFSANNLPCSNAIRQDWQAKIDAMVPKVVNAVGDIKKVLAQADYRPGDYQLVIQSYAAPIGPNIPENLRNLNGCPFRTEDLTWISQDGVQTLATGLRKAAVQSGAKFLDLSRAGTGHEACSGGANSSSEWFSRLTFQLKDIQQVDRATHALQESFHPNAAGHKQFGQCLTQFLSSTSQASACLVGADGQLHPAPIVSAS